MQTIFDGGHRPEEDEQTGAGEYCRLTTMLLLDARLMWQGWFSLALIPWLSMASGTAREQAAAGSVDPDLALVPVSRRGRRAGNVVYVNFR
jgi:hypothetical protein